MTKKQKGFTLVELMIVVAIIGILAAVAIPKFAQMLEKSREGATKGNLGAIRSAVSNYYADQQGWYPVSMDTVSYWITSTSTSLPAFCPTYLDAVLPGVKATGKATFNAAADQNHGPGSNPSSANTVTTGNWISPGFLNVSAGYGWKYDAPNTLNTNGASGVVWVNSEMKDMSNLSYTVYGFQ
ncbi:MAG TPA: type II secretion system protein [bacterium]|nr:type II secretion system protein [bacterium]